MKGQAGRNSLRFLLRVGENISEPEGPVSYEITPQVSWRPWADSSSGLLFFLSLVFSESQLQVIDQQLFSRPPSFALVAVVTVDGIISTLLSAKVLSRSERICSWRPTGSALRRSQNFLPNRRTKWTSSAGLDRCHWISSADVS